MVYYVHVVAVAVGSVQATPPLQLNDVRLAYLLADCWLAWRRQGALHMLCIQASLCCWDNADYATSLLRIPTVRC